MNTENVQSPLISLLMDDSERHPLVAESKDWDAIRPAIAEFIVMIPALTKAGPLTGFSNFVVTMMESVYVMGYKRGKRETVTGMDWVVGEEE